LIYLLSEVKKNTDTISPIIVPNKKNGSLVLPNVDALKNINSNDAIPIKLSLILLCIVFELGGG